MNVRLQKILQGRIGKGYEKEYLLHVHVCNISVVVSAMTDSTAVKKGGPPGKGGPAPTVQQIQSDKVTQLANQYWAPYSQMPRAAFNPKVSILVVLLLRIWETVKCMYTCVHTND